MKFIRFAFVFFVVISVSCCTASSKSKTATTTTNVVKPSGINFIEDDWNNALQQAKAKNKLVFLDIYATWCGPCKMLKQYTFSDTAVGSFFNQNFINISVDGEKGIGPQLAQQFSINGYPSLIITDAQGKAILFTEGYMPADYLLKFAADALKKSKTHS